MKKLTIKSYEEASELVVLSEKEIKANEAFVKLTTIVKALNGKWVADLSDWSQPKYIIYSRYLYSVLFGGNASDGALAGFGCSYTITAPSIAAATIGSRLCLKSRDDAEYIIETFPDLLKDFFMVEQ